MIVLDLCSDYIYVTAFDQFMPHYDFGLVNNMTQT